VRHGTDRGSVTLAGRRVPVHRPRVRAADGSGELPVPTYELFSSTEVLGRLAMEKMLAGLSSRRYGPVRLEPVGEQVTAAARSTSKSAVSRKFVAQTETALAELLSADLSGLHLVALMVDGVHFADTCCVVALGIDLQGNKIPLALGEGSTGNATLVTELLVRSLGVPPTLSRPLRSTKAIESMTSICRDSSRNVNRWRDGQMALRWCAAGMVRPASSSAASMDTCTCPHYATLSSARFAKLSEPSRKMTS